MTILPVVSDRRSLSLASFCGISMLIGIPWVRCRYYGGMVDMIIMRFTEFEMHPHVFLILTNAMVTSSIYNVMIIIGIFG